ncbi:MAG: hypothetical protein HYX53_07770 [Chloroflexi bacterium]|nr:hypothetical protein [Chloroflexota bacterium]
MTEADVAAFSEFPLMWLGSSFGGYQLQAVIRTKYDGPKDGPPKFAGNSVTFIYGVCVPSPQSDGGCGVPLTIHVRPACDIAREDIAPEAMVQAPYRKGTAEIYELRDLATMIYTGDVLVTINVEGQPDLRQAAVDALSGVGGAAAGNYSTIGSAPAMKACK